MQKTPFALLLLAFLAIQTQSLAQPNSTAKEEAFTIEGYYKLKWGYADEFIALYKKNHYPLLKKALEKGDILSIKAEKPELHSSEDSRWDYRVTIVYKNARIAYDHGLTEPYKKELYPDLEKLKKEEQHRFELLLAHWDIPVETVDLDKP